MKTFFSIMFLPLRPDLQEKISVGLIMSDGEKTLFEVSNSKLQVIKDLIPVHRYNLIKSYFKNIADEINQEIKTNELVFEDKTSDHWISEPYFHYLNRYSSNLVTYSEPRKINLEITNGNFQVLFEKFVFEYEKEPQATSVETILSKVQKNLYSRIEPRVNLNVTLKPKDFNELVTPVDVNFLGKNGVAVAGQTLDFGKRLYNLEHDLNNYISFTKAVDFVNKAGGHYFLVGQEPDKKAHPKNHRTWRYVRESNLVDYVDLEETDRIQDYIFSKGVTPYFEKEEISR